LIETFANFIALATALLGSSRQTRETLHHATPTYNPLQSSRSLLRSPDMRLSCSASSAAVSVRPNHPSPAQHGLSKRRNNMTMNGVPQKRSRVANGAAIQSTFSLDVCFWARTGTTTFPALSSHSPDWCTLRWNTFPPSSLPRT
jgi:hypothetical protein